MVSVTKPWLWLPPETAHNLLPLALPIVAKLKGKGSLSWRSLDWKKLHFPNPLGIAGGVDKNAQNILDWQNLGAGFVEVGTITPEPQGPNPGQILDRDTKKQWLWNKMGFPNNGLKAAKLQLTKTKNRRIPLFANIGKNRNVSNELAAESYRLLISELKGVADAFVINISSPNTQGLRELLEPHNLKKFLSEISQQNSATQPLLLKLSPDMDDKILLNAVDIAVDTGIDGFILTNTRNNSAKYFPQHEGGGVSGSALRELSESKLKLLAQHVHRHNLDKLIVSVGGILKPEDVFKRLDLGAHLVQTYAALIFNGPTFFQQVHRESQRWQ